MRRPYVIFIRGREHSWAVNIELTPEGVKDMRADGVELGEVWYSIPALVVSMGLTRIWTFAADVFHFRNPFRS